MKKSCSAMVLESVLNQEWCNSKNLFTAAREFEPSNPARAHIHGHPRRIKILPIIARTDGIDPIFSYSIPYLSARILTEMSRESLWGGGLLLAQEASHREKFNLSKFIAELFLCSATARRSCRLFLSSSTGFMWLSSGRRNFKFRGSISASKSLFNCIQLSING